MAVQPHKGENMTVGTLVIVSADPDATSVHARFPFNDLTATITFDGAILCKEGLPVAESNPSTERTDWDMDGKSCLGEWIFNYDNTDYQVLVIIKNKTTPDIADRVYYGTDSFMNERQKWRVTGYLKEYVPPPLTTGLKKQEHLVNEILQHISQNEDDLLKDQREARIKRGMTTRRCKYVWCLKEEATHVTLTSICGAIAPIGAVELNGTVDWEPEAIKKEIEKWKTSFLLGKTTDCGWAYEDKVF